MKFTVIIPTMWRFALFPRFLDDVVDNIYIDQIIIINNDNTRTPELPKSEKIILIDKGRNLKVNPSWNLAVRLSRNEDICIINDDIIYDLRIFKHLSKIDQNQFGAAGMVLSREGVGQPEMQSGIIDIKLLESNYFGFGQFMYVKKSQWINIPYELELGFGDDWVVHTNINRNLLVYNIHECMTKTEGSMTMREIPNQVKGYEFEKETYHQLIGSFTNNTEDSVAQLKQSLRLEPELLKLLIKSNSATIIGKNTSIVSKTLLSSDFEVKAFEAVFDIDLQRSFIQISKFHKAQYELIYDLDLDIDITDVLFVNIKLDIERYSNRVKNYIITPRDLNFNLDQNWKVDSTYNEYIIFARKDVLDK